MTGIPFHLENRGTSRRNPYAFSMDRIEPMKGYTIGNVRLVLLSVNLAMNEFGEGHLREIAEALALGVFRGETLRMLAEPQSEAA